MELSQEERLAERLKSILQEAGVQNKSKAVRLTIVFDENGRPLVWWPEAIAKAEGVKTANKT